MHQIREELDILFRRTLPEAVLESIRHFGEIPNNSNFYENIDILDYSFNAFKHYSQLNFPEYSSDEIESRYNYINSNQVKNNIFELLSFYADEVLTSKGKEIQCKMKYLLGWDSITKRVGQDLFISAWLAYKDIQSPENIDKQKFTYPTILRTDDGRIENLIKKGLAENHFHLNGSTQNFSLTWITFMNHTETIYKYCKKFLKTNLSISASLGEADNVLSWEERIKYAALIRVLLFERIVEKIDKKETIAEFKKHDIFNLGNNISQKIENAQYYYGVKFNQPNNKVKCLDYAISNRLYLVDKDSCNRFLAGERSFLYHCFKKIFTREFTHQEATLFYLYILIKNNFRSEMIQINKRVGFQNFSEYQDRKDEAYEELEEYIYESYRIGISDAILENNLKYLEARIMPQNLNSCIKKLDKYDNFIKNENEQYQGVSPHYVTHFAKKKFRKKELKYSTILSFPRNYPVRSKIRLQAIKMAKYLQKVDADKSRIRGIDACSMEIGCRPETFATEFRYLRKCSTLPAFSSYWYKDKRHNRLGFTYHAGEDFMDIIDGLRAIEETIVFLEYENGDRIGHALALGVDARDYYQSKRNVIFLNKQDYLDNLLWILDRSLDWNIDIQLNNKTFMEKKAEELFREIYWKEASAHFQSFSDCFLAYKNSWYLRSDHPDLYITGCYVPDTRPLKSLYDCYKIRNDEKVDKYRNDRGTSYMYYLYHFDKSIKETGLLSERINICNWVVDLVDKFQQKLREEIAKRGICIECNPTSNVLIGTFKRYDCHPILKFTDYHLNDNSKKPQIKTSINTDDLGVFDTSLENEYALLFCALQRSRHEMGNYNDEAIISYLDYLRQNGIDMSFKE